MACVETAIEYLNSFQKYFQKQGHDIDGIRWATGIVVDKEGNLVPYMLYESHRSFKKSLRALADGAAIDSVPFIFQRIRPCDQCLPTIKERAHIEEGIKHFEIRPGEPIPSCRHK